MEENQGFNPFQIITWGLLAAVIALLVYLGTSHSGTKKAEEAEQARVEKAVAVKEVAAGEDNLMGNWTIKVQAGEDASHLMGVIERDSLGGFMLRVLSEYEPRIYGIRVEEDGTLWSDELGEGRMSVKESIGKTTITFKKDSSTCTLTR